MQMKLSKSVAGVAAVLVLGVAGPALATAADEGNNEGQSTAEEQQSGEHGDVENTDLAVEVEEADGANNQEGVNEEGEVGDGADGQVDDEVDDEVDDGPSGDTEGE